MFKNKVSKILYGGDYNPEQWPREVWDEDMRMFDIAGIDIATVNVFSWALNQPDEETYQFDWLDEVMDLLHKHGVHACMGTSTAAHPAWMATRYPDVLLVDEEGRKRKFGRRHNSCPNSPTYRKYSERMAHKLAERYKDHPALLLWHVNNEYGLSCYCENCAAAFRVWLRKRYDTLEAVNEAWNTCFWGHTFYSWEEIVPPSFLSEHHELNGQVVSAFQGLSVDYARFMSDSILECYNLERDAIKRVIPDAIVTTNFQDNGTYKPLDYFRWAKELDVVALDMYPTNDMPPSHMAMRYDLMRGLKNGDPFLLMESCPSALNWKAYNALKRPGITKLWSYQSIARGADSIMYFQMRKSVGAFEKFHGALIDHSGHEHTRVFNECAELGQELKRLGDTLLGSRVQAKVAIVFDWDNWWALEYSSGPTIRLKYLNEVQKIYDALYRMNIQVDMIGVETDLSGYELVFAPVLYMVKEGYAEKLEAFVAAGGVFVTTFLSGIVGESDLVRPGGYPGELRNLLGIWVEETDALFPERPNRIVMSQDASWSGEFECDIVCDLLHSEGAEVLAAYGRDFYSGMPALTRHAYGKGEAWYIATSPDEAFLDRLSAYLCRERGIQPVMETPTGVEASRRAKDGAEYFFLLNHREEEVMVSLGNEVYLDMISGTEISRHAVMAAKAVRILRKR